MIPVWNFRSSNPLWFFDCAIWRKSDQPNSRILKIESDFQYLREIIFAGTNYEKMEKDVDQSANIKKIP